MYKKIHESEYGSGPMNFHISKRDDELHVELTYPPWTDADNKNGQCRYVCVDQEATRASDGVRLHYDYQRDGFVVEQPKFSLKKTGADSYDTITSWIEVGFFQSWKFESDGGGEWPRASDYEAADVEFESAKRS
jgi:hypothetical protein